MGEQEIVENDLNMSLPKKSEGKPVSIQPYAKISSEFIKKRSEGNMHPLEEDSCYPGEGTDPTIMTREELATIEIFSNIRRNEANNS